MKIICLSTELCDGITRESFIHSAEQVNASSLVIIIMHEDGTKVKVNVLPYTYLVH